jgi:hypothetical protein
MYRYLIFIVLLLNAAVFSQTKDAFDQGGGGNGGLFDGSSLQSQGLYATMLTYQFSRPLTLNLNFGFPLFSSFSPYQNLNQHNVASTEYFKNMPIDVSLSWKPTSNLFFQLNVVRNPQYDYFSGMSYPFYYRSMFDRSLEPLNNGK